MFKKKGEITTQQIVLLIILIVSFIVILFLLFNLDLNQSDKEICHDSVARMGTKLPDAVFQLKCSRTYLCITKDGTCERMTNPNIIKVKSKEEIYSVLAEEMADCWWMFGEGKINYVDPTWKKKNYCSVCTQFVLDDSLDEIEGIEGKINQNEFYTYLSKTKMPDKEESYVSYILGGTDIERYKRDLSRRAGEEVSFGEIKLGSPYFVVMGITSEVNKYSWYLGGAVIGGVAVIGAATGGLGVATVLTILSGEIAGGVVIGEAGVKISDLVSPKIGAIVVEGDGIDNQFMVPTIQEANSNEFKMLGCDEIITSA